MIEVEEHFYDDDPSRGQPDVRIRLKDVSYFFLGNGSIQAAVQIASSGEGTPVGLLIMNPERLAKKREALTMSPKSGLEATLLQIRSGRESFTCRNGTVHVRWSEEHRMPAVQVMWSCATYEVHESFYCSTMSKPELVREVRVKNLLGKSVLVSIKTGCPGSFAEKKVRLKASGMRRIFFRYTLDASLQRVHLDVKDALKNSPGLLRYWQNTAEVEFDHPLLNHYFFSARSQLPAVISSSGRVDGSIWQYNREWVRDQAMMAVGLTLSGQHRLARTILQRLLSEFVTEEGQPVDSSEIRHYEEVELDQNGVLLHALKHYVLWTWDLDLLKENWERIRAVAGFPLRDVFRHPASGLLANSREYWERHRAFGIRKGMELAHQLFVSLGLGDAAFLSRLIGREKEGLHWRAEAIRLKQAMLEDQRYGLVEGGRFIKRRSVNGRVQKSIQASPEAHLPPQVPLARRGEHLLHPDTSMVLPIAFEFVPADSSLAQNTMSAIEALWNQDWKGGGYGRYHISSEPDSPGPWPFPSLFAARAYAEMAEGEKVWQILDWLNTIPGAHSGAWFEFYGQRIAPPFPQVGVTPWTWAEMIILLVHHVIGVRPQSDYLLIRPKLLPGIKHIKASFPIRNTRLVLEIESKTQQEPFPVRSNGRVLRVSNGEAALAYSEKEMQVDISLPEALE